MRRFVGLVLMMMFAVHVALPVHGAAAAVALEPAEQPTRHTTGAPMSCCMDADISGQADSGSCIADCSWSPGPIGADLPLVIQHHESAGAAPQRTRYTSAVFRPPIG